MAETALISVRMPKEMAQRLEALAEAIDRSKSYVAARAIEEYLAAHEWQIRAIEEGIRAADAGKIVDHAEVEAWVNSWGTNDERGKPTCD